MKRFAVLLAVVFALALALSSCNNDNCPAYSIADTDIEYVG
ncbi:MAG TPA: hypothetical protein VMW76_10490 [Bacteroidales bacterium]|nr:hypothetical protein [Bacteroidales bacterium]